MEILPTLDLYNFTEPIATESQYILTSPRSLEACARFGIKPVELLPKSNEEFEADYGSFTENPAVLYKKFEKERLRKLRLCRQERERIIDESARGDSDDVESTHEEEIRSSEEYDQCCMMDSTRENGYAWRENGEVETSKAIEKPTILDYLDTNNNHASTNNHLNGVASPCEFTNIGTLPPSCEITQRTLSDPAIFPVQNGENGMHTKRKKQNSKLNRSKSLRMKKEKKTSTTLTPGESYEKMNGNCDSPAVSPALTYRLSSDSSSFAVHEAMSQKKQKPSKIKRTQSFRVKRENSRDEIDDLTDALPTAMKENLSLMSKKDRKLLDSYLLKMKGIEHTEPLNDCRQCWNGDVKSTAKHSRRMSCPASKVEKEENMTRPQSRSEKIEADLQAASKWKTKYEKQAQKMDQKLSSIEKERKFGNEINSNTNNNKWQKSGRKTPKSPGSPASPGLFGAPTFYDDPQTEQQLRAERMAQMQEITEKHKRAGETFQERMKQKIQQREYNKLKQAERKEFQERQLQMMEKDLKLWQQELKAYQDICLNRASKIVEKRNAITSAKTHEKRHQKEVEHAMLKSKVDEEERRRQEELKQLVNIKDTRSKMIISAKEEFANAGRESVNMPRHYKNAYKNIYSSFDKMASKGERMARLEQMNSVKKAAQNNSSQQSSGGMKHNTMNRKNQSMLTLG